MALSQNVGGEIVVTAQRKIASLWDTLKNFGNSFLDNWRNLNISLSFRQAVTQAASVVPGMNIFQAAYYAAPFARTASQWVSRQTNRYAHWSEANHPGPLTDVAVGALSGLTQAGLAIPQMLADPAATAANISSALHSGYNTLATHTTADLASMAYNQVSSMSQTRIAMDVGAVGSVLLPFAGETRVVGEAGSLGIAAEGAGGLARSSVISTETAQNFLVRNGLQSETASSFLAQIDGPITARIVEPGESFLRFTDNPTSTGSFLTTTPFATPSEAVGGLNLEPWGNEATYMQTVTATDRSIVLEGGILDGAPGVQQTIVVNRGAFQYGTGTGY